MENVSQAFVKKLYNMTDEDFEQRITEKARECFADYLFVTLAGCTTYKNRYESYLTENRVKGDCRVFGQSLTADIRTAAMINAFSAHVLELDDSHRVAMTHLGAPIFSALLAVAEAYERSTDDLLHAAVVGYEAAVRLANAVQPGHKKRGFHVSGTCCTVGCAMGIASMLRFSEEEMRNVLSAAVTSAAGLLGVASGSSEQKPYNTANAAAAGVSAALYGRYFTGADDILNGARVQLWGEGWAARFLFRDNVVTAYTILLRSYEATEESCSLLPVRQAAAAAAAMGRQGAELQVVYPDDGGDRISAVWTVREPR